MSIALETGTMAAVLRCAARAVESEQSWPDLLRPPPRPPQLLDGLPWLLADRFPDVPADGIDRLAIGLRWLGGALRAEDAVRHHLLAAAGRMLGDDGDQALACLLTRYRRMLTGGGSLADLPLADLPLADLPLADLYALPLLIAETALSRLAGREPNRAALCDHARLGRAWAALDSARYAEVIALTVRPGAAPGVLCTYLRTAAVFAAAQAGIALCLGPAEHPVETSDPVLAQAVAALAGAGLTEFDEAAHEMMFARAEGFEATSDRQATLIFPRAIILETLGTIHRAGLLDLGRLIERECAFLRGARRASGLWAYFPDLHELPADWDDIAQCLRVLDENGPDENGPDGNRAAGDLAAIEAALDRFERKGPPFSTWVIEETGGERQRRWTHRAWATPRTRKSSPISS